MPRITQSNGVADYYIYDEHGRLQFRKPELEEVENILRQKPLWYARKVKFDDSEPILQAHECPTCHQPMLKQGDKQRDNEENAG